MKNVVVIGFEGAQVLDIAGPMEVFASANQFLGEPAYRVECLGTSTGRVRMSNGLALAPLHFSKWRGTIDTIIVPGSSEAVLAGLRRQTNFVRWLVPQLAKARRIVSVCTGAFVLAEFGLLKNRTASTHWAACERLQKFSPTTKVDADAIYTKDGNVYTSAGVIAGIDLALSLVEEDLGKEVSLNIARNLVLYLRRPGGQSQFSLPLELQLAHESRIESIASFIRSNPQAELTVEALAERFSMSSRHLSRLFNEQLGESPAKYVATARLQAVKKYLESTRLEPKQIASKSGFNSHKTMSRAFSKSFGVTPGEYRTRFK